MPFIFGYLSLLKHDSRHDYVSNNRKAKLIPSKLHGYQRSWTSYRKSGLQEEKNYVTQNQFKVAPYHTWATLVKADGSVNGLCFYVGHEALAHLDAREIGYDRVEITPWITPYEPKDSFHGESVFTYIAPHSSIQSLDVRPWISADYVNMGFEGALNINQKVQGFYHDYIQSTLPCESIIYPLSHIFWSLDGRKLYKLHEPDSSIVLLHDFGKPVFQVRGDQDIHEKTRISLFDKNVDHRKVMRAKKGLFFEAMSLNNTRQLDRWIRLNKPWMDIYLSKNPWLNEKQKAVIQSRDNFVAQLILEYTRRA